MKSLNSIRKFSSRNLLKLGERNGFIANFFPREQGQDLAKYLETDTRTIYAGFDPTAKSLHVGNLMVIMGLLHAGKAGHKPIALVGGATARIGDPSGKNEERPSMSSVDINKNIKGLESNFRHIFANFEAMYGELPMTKPLILNNSVWYENVNIIDFLADYGKKFRLGKMLAKESVKRRLELKHADPNGGMSLCEFTYQAFQAYDWLHLSQNYDCFLQFGGHDQMGNISAGHDLIKRVTGKDAFGLLFPLVTSDSGMKLGKTEGNAVFMNPSMTSPFDFYQYFLRTQDTQVEQFLNFFTFLPKTEIDDLMRIQKKRPEKREAQRKLADLVTALALGKDNLEMAMKTTQLLFGADGEDSLKVLRNASREEIVKIFHAASYARFLYKHGMTMLDCAMKLGCFKNEKEAQTIIQAGGFSVNLQRRTNIDEIIRPGEHILPNHMSLIRIGKKKFVIVDWKD